ncbi:MAG: tyrosine-type recombinase/integrase [Akkermansiaceae bacterium]
MKPKGKSESLDGGLRISPWSHRSYQWRVSYFTGEGANRKRKQRGFQTKRDAMAWAESQKSALLAGGTGDHEITKDERRAVMAFREIVDSLPASLSKPTLAEIVEGYRKLADVRRRSMIVRDLIDRYLVALDKRKLSDSYRYTMKHRLARFEGDHGEWMACDVSSEVAGDWLHDIELSPVSVNHFRAALCQLFNYAMKIKVVEENPVEAIDKLKDTPGEVGILTPSQAADLLTHSSPEILPAVAIGLFAGLRRSEISRLDWEEINFEQGHVEVKAKKSKSAARRLVPMRESLRAWLSLHVQRRGLVMPTEMIYRSRLADARAAAGITDWPHNALRHSFASYHLAAFENSPALAGEMGHGSTKMIFDHYRAMRTKAEGESYWGIVPLGEEKVSTIKSA